MRCECGKKCKPKCNICGLRRCKTCRYNCDMNIKYCAVCKRRYCIYYGLGGE